MADGFRPVVDAFRALLVEHVRGSHRVGSEDGVERGIAFLLTQAAQTVLQLACGTGKADELAIGVVHVDAELVHEGLRLVGGAGQSLEHGLEAGARVTAYHAGVGERGERAGGLLHADAHAVGHQTRLIQCEAEVMGGTDGLACAGRQRVGHLSGFGARQVELFEGGGHEFGGVAYGHAVGRREVQCAAQTAGENIRGR